MIMPLAKQGIISKILGQVLQQNLRLVQVLVKFFLKVQLKVNRYLPKDVWLLLLTPSRIKG